MFTTSEVFSDQDDDMLFKHTSTRWAYNEPRRLAERYLKFNPEALKAVAASSIGRSQVDVISISKLAEGGFNRTFTIAMQDGLELIARLPYPITIPKRYATASEVATIRFVGTHGIPVPKIYDYSTTSRNPVGAEYIIMERVAGKSLRTCWTSMATDDRFDILDQLVRIEAALFAIKLPASGSIYHRKDLDLETSTLPIPGVPEDADFCVGPNALSTWWLDERADLSLDRGPYLTPQDTMASVGKREMTWMTHYAQPRFPSENLCRELFDYQKIQPTPHIEALSGYLRISDHLIPKQPSLNRFILRHPDLSPNNIFINDSMEITGVIDWQHSSILPIFLHVGIPNDFQHYDDENPIVLDELRLQTNFSELSLEEQETATELQKRREVHAFYIYRTRELNADHSAALSACYGLLRKRLFLSAAGAWRGDNVNLKADLIQVSRLWKQIASAEGGSFPECPLKYPEEEIKEHLELAGKVKEAIDEVKRVREHIGMGESGCVLPEHYDEIKARCQQLKVQSLQMAGTSLEKKEILNHFPFDDHDESGNT
ncbi:MAG: hypothetical protein Q9197_002745 [Variospora fuerteventurae]